MIDPSNPNLSFGKEEREKAMEIVSSS